MDFADTPDEAAFRAEARAWLESHATPRPPTAGADVTAILDPAFDADEGIEHARVWQARAADDGWAAVAPPDGWTPQDTERIRRSLEQVEKAGGPEF